MKKIKINFEYNSFPVWIYDENENLISNDLPEYLIGNEEIDSFFVKLQEIFNSLYSDTEKEFRYIGFKDEKTEKEFYQNVEVAKQKLTKILTSEYILVQ